MPDVVVIGSGGAGLLAACVAADTGLSVTVLERAPVLGGTTAVSGGMLWVPVNQHMAEAGVADSREEALAYLEALTLGDVDRTLLEAYVALAPEMVRYLESSTPVRLKAILRPDYHPEFPGGKSGGRTLDNLPFEASRLGDLARRTRVGSHFPPLTYEERHEWRSVENFDWELIAQRMSSDVRTLGAALAAALVAACAERGIELRTGVRALELLIEPDGVAGVLVEGSEGREEVRAGSTVVASGGFEWNPAMKRAFLRGPELNPVSPPWNVGDGIRMAMKAGAALDNMGEAWWAPTLNVPGEEYDGRPMARHVIDDLALPGSILVNRHGRRFVNEATNYNDLSKAFHVFDPSDYETPNVPAWLLFDADFKSRYTAGTIPPSDPAPPWIERGDTLDALAGHLGIDAAGLAETVAAFNEHAAAGADPAFGRGASAHDRYYGDETHAPNPCLAPLATPPFYAIKVLPGSLGTKGGIVIDGDGRALDAEGEPIARLYACGNATASVMGIGYPGAGGTLGPALAFAYACGRHVARVHEPAVRA